MSSNRNDRDSQMRRELRARATRRPSDGREERDVDATGSPRLLSQCEGIENLSRQLKASGHAVCPKLSKAFSCRGSFRRMSGYGMRADRVRSAPKRQTNASDAI